METRKVQLTGGSTFTISLPKSWATEVGIKKNSIVGLIPQTDGRLVVTPFINEEPEVKRKIFDESDLLDFDRTLRCLVGAYVMGYDHMEIRTNERLSHEVRKAIRTFSDTVIGPEIVDDSLNCVSLTDLSDSRKLTFDKSVRRMYLIVNAMLESLEIAILKNDRAMAEEVIDRDRELNRLNWLVARQYNKLMREPQLVETLGTSKERGLNLMLIARIQERIGDHADRIADNIISLERGLSKKKANGLVEALKASQHAYDNAMRSLFKKDMELANVSMNQVGDAVALCDALTEELSFDKGADTLNYAYMIESTQRIARYSKDISEAVINILVDIE